ncbi:anti-sigma factor [Brevibacillus sp. NRS-1366]|uniref:anti-sigma factor n=1 Tax=Brevibacillus sp. NRS-1366 TaxID=3233899 RepID=UPI003D222BB5
MTNKDDDIREQKLLRYLRGEMTDGEEKRLGEEVIRDEDYAQRLERLLLGEEQGQDSGKQELAALTEEKQRAIIRRGKWKMRLSNSAFTMGLTFIAGVLLFVVNGWFGSLMHDDLFRVAKDMVNFTQPGVTVGSSGSQVGLFYGKITMELREQVGSEVSNAGIFESTNILWKSSASPQWTNGVREQKLFFRYPTGEKMTLDETEHLRTPAWTTMQKLPEGTVSQLAVSFDHFLTYEEYYQLISRYVSYDTHDTVWFAVDTGQEVTKRDADEGNRLLGAGDVWGFAERELNYGNAPIQVNGEGDRRAAAYLNEMKYLTEQERLTNDIGFSLVSRGKPHIDKRYQYMQEKGVRIYGAVLTGPTKELLKLQQEKSITAAFLGKVDWWNWDRPAASGSMYSW